MALRARGNSRAKAGVWTRPCSSTRSGIQASGAGGQVRQPITGLLAIEEGRDQAATACGGSEDCCCSNSCTLSTIMAS